MAGTRYTGFLSELSGYGEASRLHLLALAAAGHPVTARSVTLAPTPRDIPVCRYRYSAVRALTKRSLAHDTVVIHTPPNHFEVFLERGVRHIGCAAWETDRVPMNWRLPMEQMDELWVPSEYCAESFRRATRRPVRVIPHPVRAEELARASFPGVPDDLFLFISLFNWSDRKNPDGLVRAFCRAFEGRDDVGLFLRIGAVRDAAAERKVDSAIALALASLRPHRRPPIFLCFEPLGPEAARRLLARSDAYVSLHRAEGFGLCLAEAMAARRPVVATGYSGNLEYMNDDGAWLVKASPRRARETRLAENLFAERMTWGEPDLDDAVDHLRACVEDAPLRERKAQRGFELVREKLCPVRVGHEMRRALEGGEPGADARRDEPGLRA